MANLTGPTLIGAQEITNVSTSQLHPLGTKVLDTDGNEYVYVKGVTSGILGAVANYDELGLTTLVGNATIGPVCVFMAILSANTYGWGQIWGSATVKTTESVDDNDLAYTTATGGAVSDTSGGSFVRVSNMVYRAAGSGATTVVAQIAYPQTNM